MIEMFSLHLLCSSVDNSATSVSRAAKVRGTFLPQEYELAKFISDVENPHASWSTATPVCEWDGVNCNKQDEVIRISWCSQGLRGALHWQHLPRSVRSLNIFNNLLSGTVDFSALPLGLVHLWVDSNAFSGELHFEHLPPNIRVLALSDCDFSGFVDFLCLQHSSLAQLGSSFSIKDNPRLHGSLSKKAVPKGVWWDIPNSWLTDEIL